MVRGGSFTIRFRTWTPSRGVDQVGRSLGCACHWLGFRCAFRLSSAQPLCHSLFARMPARVTLVSSGIMDVLVTVTVSLGPSLDPWAWLGFRCAFQPSSASICSPRFACRFRSRWWLVSSYVQIRTLLQVWNRPNANAIHRDPRIIRRIPPFLIPACLCMCCSIPGLAVCVFLSPCLFYSCFLFYSCSNYYHYS